MKAKNYIHFTALLASALMFAISTMGENHIKSFFGNQNFEIIEGFESIDISINKNPWESFTFAIDNMEVMNNPVVNLELLTNSDITLRVDLTDGIFMSSEISVLENEIAGSESFQTLSFDFTNLLDNIDLTENVFLVFYVNPGKSFSGNISIKNFKLTDASENKNINDEYLPVQGFKIFPSPATTFTNVEVPDSFYNNLRIIDMNGKIVAEFDVTFYAGTTYRVELNNLPKGYYTVQLSDNESVISEKLIVN